MTKRQAGPKGPATPQDAARIAAHAKLLQHRNVLLWLDTGDGRYAMAAWLAARQGGIVISETVLKYVDAAFAQALAAESPHQIAGALRLAGDAKAKDGPRRARERDEKIALASFVKLVHLLQGTTVSAAISAVAAERGLPYPRVKKAYYEFRDIAPGF